MDFGPGPHAGTNARGNLVADDDRLQRGLARRIQFLGHGNGPGHNVDGRMTATQAAAFVQFQGHAGGGVDHRGKHGLDLADVVTHDSRLAAPAEGRDQAGQVAVFRQAAARQDGADGVQHHIPGGGNRRCTQVLQMRAHHKLGQLVQVIGLGGSHGIPHYRDFGQTLLSYRYLTRRQEYGPAIPGNGPADSLRIAPGLAARNHVTLCLPQSSA